MTKSKGALGKGRERNGASAVGSGLGSVPDGADVDGDVSGAVVSRPGFAPNGTGVGGVAAAAGSGPRSSRSGATIGSGAPGAIGSTAANGSRFFTGTSPSTPDTHGYSSATSSMGSFPLISLVGGMPVLVLA